MNRQRLFTVALTLALAMVPGVRGRAQEKPEPAKAEPQKGEQKTEPPKTDRSPRFGPTLRVQVVITRFEGEKKIASLPYTFTVTTKGRSMRMRMGVDTPVPVNSGGGNATSFQYRNVGTNLDCLAFDAGEGRYQLQLSVENSSTLSPAAGSASGMPLFRSFNTTLDPVMRDGESVQTVAATDPVTGEVVKIDVTMNVVR